MNRSPLRPPRLPALAALPALLALLASVASADEREPLRSRIDRVQVTATRFAEQAQDVPQPVSIVTGDELRARGATDLRTALALIGGVTVATGGDQGPAASVPGLLGLREIDDLLLLVDGIPSGGAFVPMFDTVSLVDVERIEVLRGSAPVYYGTTAFAGTINIVHYPAGEADRAITVTYGTNGTIGISGAAVLSGDTADSKADGWRQSVSGELERNAFSDTHADIRRARLQYRAATGLAGGALRLDLSALHQRQRPDSPSPVGADGRPVASLSPDFNQNPSDAHIEKNAGQLTLGYDRLLSLGQWGTSLAVTHSGTRAVRGFLQDDLDADDAVATASGFKQKLRLTDVFFDTHVTSRPFETVALTWGVNELYGRAKQESRTFTYSVPLDGSGADSSAGAAPGEEAELEDARSFFGAYAQAKWQVTPTLSLLGGLRWNRTHERRSAGDDEAADAAVQSQDNRRASGTIGASWKVWADPEADFDDVTLHAGIGNTFQPPQIDFGPDAEDAPLLKPETMRHVQFGVKADGFDGRLDLDLTAFLAEFRNQVSAREVDGAPALVAAGTQRFKGVQVEGSFRLRPELSLTAHASYNDARYRDDLTEIDGAEVQLAGKRLPMSPRWLGGAGAVYAPAHGWRASLVASQVGSRWLDARNTHRFGAYTVVDASFGYALDGGAALTLNASNLGDRRDPVLPSELGEGQVYRLQGRRIALTARFALP